MLWIVGQRGLNSHLYVVSSESMTAGWWRAIIKKKEKERSRQSMEKKKIVATESKNRKHCRVCIRKLQDNKGWLEQESPGIYLGEALKMCTGDISLGMVQPPSAGKELNGGISSRRAGRPGTKQGYGIETEAKEISNCRDR